jgi:predicted nucleotidyltransferase
MIIHFTISSQLMATRTRPPITNSTNACIYCGKSYTRKTSCEKHTILCEIAHKSKRLKVCEEEETTNIPSTLQLYNIIQELAYKQQKMEEKMDEMQKWIDKKKKKLNVIHWLTTQFVPTTIFGSRIRSISVIQDDISVLVEYNFVQTVVNILKRNLEAPKDGLVKEPIACFTEKNSVFYIYKEVIIKSKTEEEQPEEKREKQWTKMEPEEFVYLLKIIHSKLLNALCAWRDVNSEKIKNSDKFAELYNKTVIKLMGVTDFNQEATLSKIRMPLYNHLKGDLKNMVEYDYEF